MDIIQSIKNRVGEIHHEILSYRRHLHRHPELSFEEVETSAFICAVLDKYGITYTKGWAGHGIVAMIKADHADEWIALRADMDALPIIEANDVDYASKNAGVMHACGHDVHTSSMLGACILLQEMKSQLKKSVKIIFQPGEEKLPGGASLMIKEGIFAQQVPKYILGQHVFPSLEVGKVGIKSGLYMASADEIYLTISGKGGHGAMPHENNDVVLAMAQTIVNLQQIVSRRSNPIIPSVLSFGKVNTDGGATNVMPSKVRIQGTFRTMDEPWRKDAHELVRSIVQNTTASFGCQYDLDIKVGYPCLINHINLVSQVKKAMIAYLGAENVADIPIRMTSEDFAFYTQQIPGCFYRLGTRNEAQGITSPVHTATFDIDEDALKVGVGLMVYLAVLGIDI